MGKRAMIDRTGAWLLPRCRKKVSNNVKGSNDKVDLGQFKDKNGKTPKNKNSGTFTSTKDKRYPIKKILPDTPDMMEL